MTQVRGGISHIICRLCSLSTWILVDEDAVSIVAFTDETFFHALSAKRLSKVALRTVSPFSLS